MKRRHVVWMSVVFLASVASFPPLTSAQGTSGIAGVVRDTSGGVLPGVTVEAASPALIEKVRTAVADSEGRFNIVDLRPGVYTVTFSLAGFSTVRREGIELPAAFTATVNADMQVGAMEETITVSGAAPLVDVQNVASQRVLPQELLDALPAARSPQGFAALTPGITSAGLGSIPGDRAEMNVASHGASAGESTYFIDGINTAEVQGAGGSSTVFRPTQAYVAEISITTGGGTPEQAYGGTVTYIIPKEGGNTFSGSFYSAYSGERFAASNLTPALRDLGFTDNSLSTLVRLWDVQWALGGRLIRDRLWFFSSHRRAGTVQTRAGLFENLTPRGWAYTPDPSRVAVNRLTDKSYNTRLTWQALPKHKISFFGDVQPHIGWQRFGTSGVISQEATTYTPYLPNAIFALIWKAPVTSRLYLDANVAYNATNFAQRRHTPETCDCLAPIIGYDVISAVETSTSTLIRSSSSIASGASDYSVQANNSYRYAANISFVTGSHSAKAGLQLLEGSERFATEPNGAQAFTLRNGAPISLGQWANPIVWENVVQPDLGLFAQDQWTLKRLTVTGGARFDYLNIGYAAKDLGPGIWVPARSFPKTSGLNWKDVSPRIAGALDLFGDGKTAIKATLGRFVMAQGATSGGINQNNPVPRSVTFVTRTWADANGNFNPDCDLVNRFANGECGQISDLNFGQNNPNAIVYDPELLNGLRNHNWETTVVAQRQLAAGVSVTAGYYRRSFSNFSSNDNQLVTPADYSQYCITAPVDARLPGGGGNQICGLYDISPALFGRNQAVVRSAEHYGQQSQVYNGVDLTENIRLKNGATISGGVNFGRTATNTCFVVDSPQALRFCDIRPSFKALVNATFVAFYPMPWWGLLTSATYRDYPGPEIAATHLVRNAEIAPSLGRNLSNGANGTVNVALIQPGTMYGPRQRQFDFRISKRVRFGRARFMGNMDIFNLLNTTATNTLNNTFGPNWQRPNLLQQGRYVKLNVQIDF
jgi:hypothetical protein